MQSDEVLLVEMKRTESDTAMSSEVGSCDHIGNNVSGKEQSRTAGGATAQREEVITVLLVTLVSSVWSLAATTIPVFVGTIGSNDLHPEYYGWYRGGDIVRFVEPILGLLFSFWIFHASGFLQYDARGGLTFNQLITLVYIFGVTLYLQGGAFHSASNMFKHGVEIFLDDYLPIDSVNTPDEIAQREYMEDFKYWMRTVWQHIVSHYIYAVGACIMQACVVVAYRNHTVHFQHTLGNTLLVEGNKTSSPLQPHSSSLDSVKNASCRPAISSELDTRSLTLTFRLIIANSIVYSFLLSSVAINFPSGLIVGFLYFPLYLMSVSWFKQRVGDWDLMMTENFRVWLSTRPIVNMYFIAFILSLIIMLVWVAVVGGVHKRSDAT